MARYRLKDKHYLNVEIGGVPTEWEQKELNQATGKEVRKRYLVPTLLNPDDPTDCNYPGEIIVASTDDPRYPRDIIYKGPPSADMEPLDDEARKVLSSMSFGEHPIESLPGTMSDSLLTKLEALIDAASKNNPQGVAITGVSQQDFSALQEQVAALMAQNAELVASLSSQPKATIPQVARRA